MPSSKSGKIARLVYLTFFIRRSSDALNSEKEFTTASTTCAMTRDQTKKTQVKLVGTVFVVQESSKIRSPAHSSLVITTFPTTH